MATVEEVLAKAAEWEAAGNPTNAAKLRAYAETLQPLAPKHDRKTVEAKAAEWEAAGQPEKAAKLRSYAGSLPVEVKKPMSDAEMVATGPAQPPRARTPEEERQTAIDDFALFEMANPDLRGKFKPGDALPKAGTKVGGSNARAVRTVQPWRESDIRASKDTFGETAARMVEGPIASFGSFRAGVTDSSQSPSREYLANDPLTRELPDWMLTAFSKVGDVGGAGLSLLGAGISGAAGLGVELVPGQSAADEKKLAEELTGMAMFAVPELAGVSSVPARLATTAPKVAPVVRAAPGVADAVAAAERLKIPVMRTDVKPPTTAIGKISRRVGESIPIAGTAGMRAKQFKARADAVADFVQQYVGDTVMPAIDAVTESFRKVHGKTVEKYADQKNSVIEGAAKGGVVPMPNAIAAIDAQIGKLAAAKNEGFAPIIAELEGFKKSITDQKLTEIDMNRAQLGEVFKGFSAEKIKGAGEKALSAIYGPIKQDMSAFIERVLGKGAVAKWDEANVQLSGLSNEVNKTALRTVLKKGDVTPEVVKTMLFSQKPSDLRLLYRSLDPDGRKAARTAIVQEAVAKATKIDGMSVEQFKLALDRMGAQVGEFFRLEDKEAAQGLLRALKLTEHAAKAGAAPLTGTQNLPAFVTLMASSFTGGSLVGTSAALGTIGGLARLYEATGVKTALRRLAKMENPKVQKQGLLKLDRALREAGMPAVAQQNYDRPRAVGQN